MGTTPEEINFRNWNNPGTSGITVPSGPFVPESPGVPAGDMMPYTGTRSGIVSLNPRNPLLFEVPNIPIPQVDIPSRGAEIVRGLRQIPRQLTYSAADAAAAGSVGSAHFGPTPRAGLPVPVATGSMTVPGGASAVSNASALVPVNGAQLTTAGGGYGRPIIEGQLATSDMVPTGGGANGGGSSGNAGAGRGAGGGFNIAKAAGAVRNFLAGSAVPGLAGSFASQINAIEHPQLTDRQFMDLAEANPAFAAQNMEYLKSLYAQSSARPQNPTATQPTDTRTPDQREDEGKGLLNWLGNALTAPTSSFDLSRMPTSPRSRLYEAEQKNKQEKRTPGIRNFDRKEISVALGGTKGEQTTDKNIPGPPQSDMEAAKERAKLYLMSPQERLAYAGQEGVNKIKEPLNDFSKWLFSKVGDQENYSAPVFDITTPDQVVEKSRLKSSKQTKEITPLIPYVLPGQQTQESPTPSLPTIDYLTPEQRFAAQKDYTAAQKQEGTDGVMKVRGFDKVNNLQAAPGDDTGHNFYRKTNVLDVERLKKEDPARYKAMVDLFSARNADAAKQGKSAGGAQLAPETMNGLEEYRVEIPGKGWMTGIRKIDPNRPQGTFSVTPGMSDGEKQQYADIMQNEKRNAEYAAGRGKAYDAMLINNAERARDQSKMEYEALKFKAERGDAQATRELEARKAQADSFYKGTMADLRRAEIAGRGQFKLTPNDYIETTDAQGTKTSRLNYDVIGKKFGFNRLPDSKNHKELVKKGELKPGYTYYSQDGFYQVDPEIGDIRPIAIPMASGTYPSWQEPQ